MKFIDLTGKRYGRLVVIERTKNKGSKTAWLCKCDCGNEKIVTGDGLNRGNTKSCGCLSKEIARNRQYKHGKTQCRLYNVWYSMKRRCYDKNVKNFNKYGGRGIKVCEEWLNDFLSFYNWAISNGYRDDVERGKLTLDRIDNNKGYYPDNCRWVNQKIQNRNKTNLFMITYNGKTLCAQEWAEKLGCRASLIIERIKRGWSIEDAFFLPKKR